MILILQFTYAKKYNFTKNIIIIRILNLNQVSRIDFKHYLIKKSKTEILNGG